MLVWLKQSHSDQFMYFSVKRKNNNNEKKKNLHSHFPLVRPYLWKYLQYYHYLFHFYWIFFCISISSSSHNLPSPVLLWLDRTLDIRHELASGWPQRRSRITNAPGSRIKTHLSFFYLYLPTFLIFPDGSSLFHFPLLVSFRGSQFSHISPTFFPIVFITACFWHCAACSLLLCCASSSSVSGRWTEKWIREINIQANFRCPGKKPSCLYLES